MTKKTSLFVFPFFVVFLFFVVTEMVVMISGLSGSIWVFFSSSKDWLGYVALGSLDTLG